MGLIAMEPTMSMLPHMATITRVMKTGRGEAPVEVGQVACSVDRRTKVSAGPDGPRTVSYHRLVVRPGHGITVGDRLTITGVTGAGEVLRVWEVTPRVGPSGTPSHVEVVAW